MDLQGLHYSVLVADHYSFRKAALAIGVGQSVVSRRVRALEDEIGVSIFQRHSGGVRLTNAGVEFVRAIRKALQDIDIAVSIAGNAGSANTGYLFVGFCSSLSTGELRNTLIDYIYRYPNVAVRVVEGSRSQLATSLRSQTLDIAIVPDGIDDKSADTMELWSERVIVALPAAHSLTSPPKIHWSDLKREQFLVSSRDAGHDARDFLLNRFGTECLRPVIISQDVSNENILAMVGAGQGLSLLHECATGVAFAGVTYREVYDGDSPTRVRNSAFWHADNDNPALRRFLSLLRERYVGAPPLLSLREG